MFLLHPIVQFAGILIVLYVAKLGVSRFRMIHLKQKIIFKWKLHVRLGIIAISIWIIGLIGGLYIVKTNWFVIFVTGVHAEIGLVMIPFIIFAITSGLYMDRRKRKRKVLPFFHAILNTLMLLLALSQVYTGINVYLKYVL